MSHPIDNPYEPPVGEYGPTLADPDLEDEEQIIRRRVSRPGTALLIMGSTYSVFPAMYLLGFHRALFINRIPVEDILVVAAFFFSSIAIAVGGAKMAFMESYSIAKIGAVLACIPPISPFVGWGIPIGIWALIVLRDRRLSCFRGQSSKEPLRGWLFWKHRDTECTERKARGIGRGGRRERQEVEE